MRLVVILTALAISASAQIIPGKYVVELQTEPMGAMARNRAAGADALNRRATIGAEQKSARALIEGRGGRVLGSMRNVINAVAVDIPEERAAELQAMPGVKKVFPVGIVKMNLDHALPLHKVPQAWAQIGGMSKAGLGVKIAILDTGITPGHAAFQDPSLVVPAGYPIVSGPENKAVVNNKIIVARNYANYYQLTQPDSAIDFVGHGTATADCAAGMPATGPYTTVTGVAPKAFIGVYKITPLNSGGASTAVIVAALDDAVGDGMDVINLSFGSPVEFYSSLQNYVLDRVTRLGIVTVLSAGNSGSFPDTIGDGADNPSVISVGATNNDREFAGSVAATGITSIVATAGAYGTPNKPVTTTMTDMATVDPKNLGCGGALPANSLKGVIALTQTTSGCFFETILNNAANAGAVGVIFYNAPAGSPRSGTYTPLTATLPSVYVSNTDAGTLRTLIPTATPVTVTFEGVPTPNDPHVLASFSSRGPTDFSDLKPDISATGTFVYMAAESVDPTGELYSSTGYTQADGTSFSSPIVAGAAAVLKGARPGLTMDQYRSLLINSTDPLILSSGNPEKLQRTGAGVLNLKTAMSSTVTAFPTSLSFGTGGNNLSSYDLLTITNVGTQVETFTVSAIPYDTAPAPSFSTDGSNVYLGKPGSAKLSVPLSPGRSQVIYVNWAANRLATGEYQGQIMARGELTGSTALVPYWYAYPDGKPQYLSTLGVPTQANAGTAIGLYFKVTDSTGTAVDPTTLSITSSVVSGGGKLQGPFLSTSYVNWIYLIATLSTTPGTNVFTYTVKGFSPITYTIQGVKPSNATATDSFFSSLLPNGSEQPVQLRALQAQP
jgi:minor extracellular serine protease Vpr